MWPVRYFRRKTSPSEKFSRATELLIPSKSPNKQGTLTLISLKRELTLDIKFVSKCVSAVGFNGHDVLLQFSEMHSLHKFNHQDCAAAASIAMGRAYPAGNGAYHV